MEQKEKILEENFVDREKEAFSSNKGGESITPLIDTENKGFSLEGIEFWNNQNLNEKTGLEVKLDYLTFNIPNRFISQDYEEYLLESLIEALKLKGMSCDSKYNYSELLGYTRCIKNYTDGTTIIVNDTKRENQFLEIEYLTRIELKGSGCREFEARGGNWKELMNYIIMKDGYLTRVDLAIDDKKVYLTPKQLDYHFRHRHFKSIFKEFREDSTKSSIDKINKGWGILFGSKNSSTKLRIYDKKLEQVSKGETIDLDIKNWVRYELRFMHDKAKSIIYELKENILNLEVWATSLLKGCLTLLSPTKNDSNKSRWNTLKAWEDMLIDLEKSKVKILDEFKHNSNYASMCKWLETSCSKSFVIDYLVNDENDREKHNLEIKLIGLLKLNGVDLNMINNARNFMLHDLTMNDIQKEIKETNKKLSLYHSPISMRNFKEKIEKMFNANYEYLINACKVG